MISDYEQALANNTVDRLAELEDTNAELEAAVAGMRDKWTPPEDAEKLQTASAELLDALKRIEHADTKGFIDLKNFRKGVTEAIHKAKEK